MANYGEYCTLPDFRTTYAGSLTTDTGQDPLITQLIRGVSKEMDQGGRWFHPRIVTRYYGTVYTRQLDIDDTDWLEVTTVSSGSYGTVAAGDYDLLPYLGPPYHAVRLQLTSGLVWYLNSEGSPERAISITGIAGYHKDYSSAWQEPGATLAAAITTTSATTFTCTTGKIQAGHLMKIDSEYLYASSVSTGASDTVTCVRGVNGSTAATHLISTTIYTWSPGFDLETLCKAAVQARLRLKDNPTGETVRIGESSFSTPKDVTKWITAQLGELGYLRVY